MTSDDLSNAKLFKKLLQVIDKQAKRTYEDITTDIKTETPKLLKENRDKLS